MRNILLDAQVRWQDYTAIGAMSRLIIKLYNLMYINIDVRPGLTRIDLPVTSSHRRVTCRASRVPERAGNHRHRVVARRRGNRLLPGKQQLTAAHETTL